MIVIADTSPINYLTQINHADLLRQLYGTLVLPDAVHRELQQPGTPQSVYAWAAHLPDWIELRKPVQPIRAELRALDPGESSAIELAIEMHADLLLIDERKASSIAQRVFGLKVIGTLGVLLQAHRAGLIDGNDAFDQLCTQTNFHWTPELRERFQMLLRSSNSPEPLLESSYPDR